MVSVVLSAADASRFKLSTRFSSSRIRVLFFLQTCERVLHFVLLCSCGRKLVRQVCYCRCKFFFVFEAIFILFLPLLFASKFYCDLCELGLHAFDGVQGRLQCIGVLHLHRFVCRLCQLHFRTQSCIFFVGQLLQFTIIESVLCSA